MLKDRMDNSRPFDDDLYEPTPVLPGIVGSIAFNANKNTPCYCAECVVLRAEVERLRHGNRVLLDKLFAAKRWYFIEYGIEEGADVIYPWEGQ